MENIRQIVIIGASLAGAKAAETLRAEGFDGAVIMVGEEPVRPYERPPLSKDYLRGESGFDSAAVHEGDYYSKSDIELRTSTKAVAVDISDSVVSLDSGERIPYDRLLLATGATPRRLTVPGSDLPGVHYLRTLADADDLSAAVVSSSPVVVIGAGWIGAEVAASARQMGAEVSMVELASVPLERVLGPDVGRVYAELHARHGVSLHFGVGVDSLAGAGRVEEVRLTDGTVLPAATIVVGVGVVPRTELAEAAGIESRNGILVDEHLATSAANVFAAGDVANAFHPLYGTHIRLEHWSAALNQGPMAAKNMLGGVVPYDRTPYFFSDQYELGMEYRGWAPAFDSVIFRGRPEQGEFIAFWLDGGSVLAAMNANIWDEGDTLEALVRRRLRVDPSALANLDVRLDTLVPP